MDSLNVQRITGKSYKISGRAARKGGRQQKRAVKRLIGVLLLVIAGVFGGVVASMPVWAAFVTVFLYISVQLWIWIEAPEKEN